MAPKIFVIFIIQMLVFKVYSSQVQPGRTQYIIASPQQQLALQSVLPASSKPSTSLSTLASLASLLSPGSTASLNSLVKTAVPKHVPTPVPIPAPEPEKPTTSSGIDMELLNNLAIALQLMIVNNILASPLPEAPATTNTETVPSFPPFDSIENLSYAPIQNDLPPIANVYQPYQPSPYESQSFNPMPNANFVGSSGFSEPNPFLSTVPPPLPTRSGLSLMSPYEALSPSSPYLDPILSSPYGSVMTSKKDFQSPYASILGSDKDYFSMSSFGDLF